MAFFTVKKDAVSEFCEKKSRFIGQVFFVTSEEEATAKLKEIKEKYSDATHNCWAYSLKDSSKRRFSDDGEPSGTAGAPILQAIDNTGLCDVLIVVTRYFGGTLLGAGGLVRAYTKAAADAISVAEKTEIVPFITFETVFDYEKQGRVFTTLSKFSFEKISENYGEKISLSAKMEKEDFQKFESAIKNYFYDFDLRIISEKSDRR